MGSLQRCRGRRAQAGRQRRLPGAFLTRRTRSGSSGVGRLALAPLQEVGPAGPAASPPPAAAAPGSPCPGIASAQRAALDAHATVPRPCLPGARGQGGGAGTASWHPGGFAGARRCCAVLGWGGFGASRWGLRPRRTGRCPGVGMRWTPEEGFPRKSEAPGLGPCPLPATVAILALMPFNYRPRQAWPCVPLHYAIAIGAAPPSRPTPVDN